MKRVLSFYSLPLSNIILSVILIIALLSLASCSQTKDTTTNDSDKTPTNTPNVDTGKEYSIAIFLNDTQVGSLTLEQLSTLQKVTFSTEGKDEEGTTVLSALKLMGINKYSEITFYGFSKGRLATAELKLTKAQINDAVIFDFSNQGTVKLASPNIPSNNWVIDVTKVEIK